MIDNLEIDALMESTATVVREYVAVEVAKMTAQIEAAGQRILEDVQRRIKEIPVGTKGEKGDPGESIVGPAGERGEKGETGREGVSAYGIAIRTGAFTGSDAEWIQSLKGHKGDKGDPGETTIGPPGPKGEDAPPVDLDTVVLKVLEMVPVPKDGAAGPKGESGERGEQGLAGKDGERGEIGPAGIAGPMGTKGETGERGDAGLSVKGDPGEKGERGERGEKGESGLSIKGDKGDPGTSGIDGKDGQSVHPDTVSLMIVNEVKHAVAAIPKAADGRDALEIDILPAIPPKSVLRGTFVQHKGGLWRAKRETGGGLTWVADEWDLIINGLRNVSVVQLENQRSFGIEIELASGLKETSVISVPVLIYREIFRDGTEYEKGDVVTFGGCAWHCNTDKTKAKPGNGSADWKMMVKEGRAGKDGINGKDGARGPDGQRGKDLTQQGWDGAKH